MKKFILSILAVWAVLPLFSQTYRELTDMAITATEQDSLEQAEGYIRQALALEPANPRNALLLSNLGTIQRRLHRYDQALESYTLALNHAPRMVSILMNRATLYLEMSEYDLAQVDYSLVLDLDKDNEEALLMRAYAYMQKYDFNLARADYKHLLTLNPLHFNGALGFAMLEEKEGNFKEALAILDHKIAEGKSPTGTLTAAQKAVVYVARAELEFNLEHPDLAMLDLEEANRLNPAQAEIYLLRGKIYLSQKKKEWARREFEEAMSRGLPQAELNDLLQQCK